MSIATEVKVRDLEQRLEALELLVRDMAEKLERLEHMLAQATRTTTRKVG
jgi:predicted  nucleic acid-binding Zn-ribbon protein